MNLAKLAEFGIKATVTQAGKLHIEAPKGAITPELRQEIAENKAFLLAEMNMMNFMNIKSSCMDPRARAYTGEGHVHIPGKPGFDELHEHDELQNHMYGPARAHIYPESHVHTPPANDPITRRPPGLTPALLAASLALDAQIAASGTQIDDPDRHCYPHSSAANTSELDLMGRRLERFARIGMDVDQAEKLADRLKDRDREHDDRRACVECSSLTGGTGGWRCMAFRARGARDPGLPRDLVGMLARCPVFVAGEPSGGVFTTARPANEPRLSKSGRTPGPWLTASESSAAQQYHQHHAQCPQCQAGGRGYSSRCSVGAALWDQYQQEGTTQ